MWFPTQSINSLLRSKLFYSIYQKFHLVRGVIEGYHLFADATFYRLNCYKIRMHIFFWFRGIHTNIAMYLHDFTYIKCIIFFPFSTKFLKETPSVYAYIIRAFMYTRRRQHRSVGEFFSTFIASHETYNF